MKHGDKAKKSAKAVKASGEKASSKEAVAKARKESGSSKSSKEAGTKAGAQKAGTGKTESRDATKAPAKAATKAPAKETSAKAVSGGNGKNKAVADTVGSGFANPAVGASFKRALKKYSNAFRRLTD